MKFRVQPRSSPESPFLNGGCLFLFASWMNRAAIFGIDIRKDRRFGKLDWLGNGRLRRWIGAFLGPAATVTTCSFFATILDHLHLLVAQVPTPQWQGRSAPDRKRRSVIRGKDSPKSFPWSSSRQYNLVDCNS